MNEILILSVIILVILLALIGKIQNFFARLLINSIIISSLFYVTFIYENGTIFLSLYENIHKQEEKKAKTDNEGTDSTEVEQGLLSSTSPDKVGGNETGVDSSAKVEVPELSETKPEMPKIITAPSPVINYAKYRSQIVNTANRYNSRFFSGMDLIQKCFSKITNTKLPRTIEGLKSITQRIENPELGDLVFYTYRGQEYAGIMVGNNTMIHSYYVDNRIYKINFEKSDKKHEIKFEVIEYRTLIKSNDIELI